MRAGEQVHFLYPLSVNVNIDDFTNGSYSSKMPTKVNFGTKSSSELMFRGLHSTISGDYSWHLDLRSDTQYA